MSIRTALILAMTAVAVLSTAVLAVVGITTINESIIREVQSRVDHDLRVVSSEYQRRLQVLAERLENRADKILPDDKNVAASIRRIREELGFTVLNLCDTEGRALAGGFPDRPSMVPVSTDPVLRRALEGQTASGTVLLDPGRLALEGGAALQNALVIRTEKGDAAATGTAMFWWFALPIRDAEGLIVALLYGGKAINFNYDLVDGLRELVFGSRLYEGKPLGTTTIFLDTVRVATNVLGPNGTRAIGTRVSNEVEREVLKQGQSWSDRAWVVDAWYLSGYEPLTNPDGKVIGMLYVGLLEMPYVALRAKLIRRFLVPVALVGVVAVLAALLIVRQITRPLEKLGEAANRLARYDWSIQLDQTATYSELMHLADAFRFMQEAIAERDQQLREQNQMVGETNEKLQQTNRNYMKMLGFITHELKGPLGNVQSMADILAGNLLDDKPDKAKHFLVRIKRNCEEMADMVKNYLDLSRAERGELVATKSRVLLGKEVVEPCAMQAEAMFLSRQMHLETDYPDDLTVEADPELIRIALNNYLINAAKYGREGGQARLEVATNGNEVTVCVWNEGPGFSEEDGKLLFGKFSRISNENTRDKRGSGLGLFLCKKIAELHSGKVWAESEEGQWAKFFFSIPRA